MSGPDTNLRIAPRPPIWNLIWEPPTSMTRIRAGSGGFGVAGRLERERDGMTDCHSNPCLRPSRPVLRLKVPSWRRQPRALGRKPAAARAASFRLDCGMLWLKAFHIVFVVTWFAGLFYLPRLFVYHSAASDAVGRERFVVMERRLFVMMTMGGALAIAFGASMVAAA